MTTTLGPIKKILDISSCLGHFLIEEVPRRQFSSILKEGIEEAYTVHGISFELRNIGHLSNFYLIHFSLKTCTLYSFLTSECQHAISTPLPT